MKGPTKVPVSTMSGPPPRLRITLPPLQSFRSPLILLLASFNEAARKQASIAPSGVPVVTNIALAPKVTPSTPPPPPYTTVPSPSDANHRPVAVKASKSRGRSCQKRTRMAPENHQRTSKLPTNRETHTARTTSDTRNSYNEEGLSVSS